MQNFNFNHLYYFHVVAAESGLAAAAKALGVSQSTVSEQIKQLEAFLDTKLFHRKPGGKLRLNESGRRVFEHTSVMFRVSDRLLARFRPDDPDALQVLEVGLTPSVSRTFATRYFLPLLRVERLRPRIAIGEHDHLLRALAALDIDLLLTDDLPPDPEAKGLRARKVHAPDMVVVAAPDAARDIGDVPHGLDGVAVIGYTLSSQYRWEFDRFFRNAKVVPHVVAESDDVELMATAAEAGLCIAVVPRSVVEDRIESGTLVEVAAVPEFQAAVWALYHQREASQRVLDAIEQLMQPTVSREPS